MRVTIRFSSQSTLGSWLIRKFLWSPWSHVEFVMPVGNTIGARFPGGVKVRSPLRYKEYRDCIVDVPDNTMVEAFKYIDAEYDILALFSHLFRLPLDRSRKFTCVEFVGKILHDVGWLKVPDLRRLKPSELFLVCLNRGAVK